MYGYVCAIFVSLYPGLYAKGADKTYNEGLGTEPPAGCGSSASDEGQ